MLIVLDGLKRLGGSEGDVVGVQPFSEVAGLLDGGANERAGWCLGHSAPLVALIALGPALDLVFLPVYLQPLRSLLLLLDLPTVLGLQPLLLLYLVGLLLLLLHLRVYYLLEVCKLL